jgi:hypothetical protein
MEVENGGVSLVPQKYIIALAPLHAASSQKKLLRHRRVDAIFLTALTSYSGEEGKPLPAWHSQRSAQKTDRAIPTSDHTTTSQPPRVGQNSAAQCPIRDSSLTLLPSAAFRKFLI